MDVGSRRALGSRYELLDRLGSGAMGEVWRTRDVLSDEQVAAKLLRSDLTADPEIVGRFIQERSILLTLDHPGIVRVRDLVVEGDALAIVMDLVSGEDLRAMLRRTGTLPAADAVSALAAVLDAVASAHSKGCLHRDIKPDNVLVEQGEEPLAERLRLSDFGIARLAQESTVQATGLLGTPGYMPPELFSEGRFSGASDVYAAGVMLYELLAGRTPFSGPGTAHTIGFRHVTAQPPQLPVPPALWQVISAMLSKDPTVRPTPAGAATMLRDLSASDVAGAALTPQSDPVQWTTIGGGVAAGPAGPTGPVQVREDDQIDVGATNLRGLAPTSLPWAAEQGEVVALSPNGGQVGADATNLARHLPTYAPPVLEPAAPTPEAEKRTSRWRWVAGAAVAAVIVGGVFLFVTRGLPGGDSAEAGVAGDITAATEPDTYPTGLGIETSAEYDPETGTADLVMTYSADRAPLAGEVLAVIPPVTVGGECPSVSWAGSVERNIGRSTGVLPECGGYSVPVAVRGGDRQQYQLQVTGLDLGDDPSGALQQWLDVQEQATREAVTDPKVTGVSSYPLQRITDVVLQIPSTLTLGEDSAVRVRLYPVFPDGKPDELQPLYDSESGGRPSTLLTGITGGEPLRFTPSSSCDGAVVSTGDGDVVARGTTQGCTVVGSVGNFDDVESNSLLVVGPNG